jgi:uncharacterized C2H2 Zn-finger protein
VCPVCSKEFTHSNNLKLHAIKTHKYKDLRAKRIDPELVLAKPIFKPKLRREMTDLEEIKEGRQVLSGIKVPDYIRKPLEKASKHCPKLF